MTDHSTDRDETRNARPAGAASSPAGGAPLYAKSWAVVVGIDDYRGGLPKLRNAVSDAREVARLLRERYAFDEVHTLLDAEATRGSILSWLRDHLAQDTGPDDRVIVFFAGHGVTQSLSRERVRGYLVPFDAQVSRYADYIDMQELRQACGMMSAKHVLLILDCCFSGVAAVASRSVPVPPPRLDDAYLQAITSEPAWQVLTAGRSDEPIADSGPRPGHSAFTAALLDGLEGTADTNQDGLVTAGELANYVSARVTRETRTPGSGGQTPFFNYLAGSGQGDQVFVLPDWTPPVELALELSPALLQEGRAALAVANAGGQEAQVHLQAAAPMDALQIEIDPADLSLPPGSEARAALTAGPGKGRPWLGLRRKVPFTVTALPDAGRSAEARGEMWLSPRLPVWAQGGIALLLAAAIVLAAVFWPREMLMPNVLNLHIVDALSTLSASELVVESTEAAWSPRWVEGEVRDSAPRPDTVVTPRSTVILVVAVGPTPTRMPTHTPTPTPTERVEPTPTATTTRAAGATAPPTETATPTQTPTPTLACFERPDLRVQQIYPQPYPLVEGQRYGLTLVLGNAQGIPVPLNSWIEVYLDRPPDGNPDHTQLVSTAGMEQGQRIELSFDVDEAYTGAGWHTVYAVVDARNDVDESACGGEDNNTEEFQFQIFAPTPVVTAEWADFLGHWINEDQDATAVSSVVVAREGIAILGRTTYSLNVYDWTAPPRTSFGFLEQVPWGALTTYFRGDALYGAQVLTEQGKPFLTRTIILRRSGDQMQAEAIYDYADDAQDLAAKHVLNRVNLPEPTKALDPPELLVLPTRGVIALPTATPTPES